MSDDLLEPEAEPAAEEETWLQCPDCEKRYKLPQHLGLHRYHRHGVPSAKSKRKAAKKAAAADAPKRTYTTRPRITPDDVCITVLKELVPNGRIPVETVSAYNEWVGATKDFLDALHGKLR